MAERGKYDPETGEMVWTEVGDLDVKSTVRPGNTAKDIRRWMRACNYKPTAASVEVMQREVGRSPAQNAQVERLAKEQGDTALRDEKGPVEQRVRDTVQREIDSRDG